MALQINEIYKTQAESYSQEPIMVTVSLGEYRSLIEENTRLLCRIELLETETARLIDENLRLSKDRWWYITIFEKGVLLIQGSCNVTLSEKERTMIVNALAEAVPGEADKQTIIDLMRKIVKGWFYEIL